MATIAKERAVHLLSTAVQKANANYLVEIYNEVFPQNPTTEQEAVQKAARLVGQVIDHINKGLEVEEILDLWHVVFPKHRRVWFDEEEDRIHYDEPGKSEEYQARRSTPAAC